MQLRSSFKETVFSLLAIAFVFFFPHLGIAPLFSYSVVVLVVIIFYLKRSGESLRSIGFHFKGFSWKALWVGSLTGLLLFCFLQYIFFPLLSRLVPLEPANLEGFTGIRHHTGNYIFILVMGWIVGGCYEEIAFHGFVFTRLEKILPGSFVTPIAVMITALIFAFYHSQLGTSGVLNAGLAGLAYHLLMLHFKRDGWYAFFAHGIFDTIGLSFIYLGYW